MTEIGLADSSDAFTFVSGQPIKLLLDSGAIVPMTRWDLLRVRAIAAWEWLTRRPRRGPVTLVASYGKGVRWEAEMCPVHRCIGRKHLVPAQYRDPED